MTLAALDQPRTSDALTVDAAVRRAAIAAAGLTVTSIATLGLFYSIGEPWGTVNDCVTILLAAATVPIAIFLARGRPGALPGAGVLADLVGVGLTVCATALLIARAVSFEASLPYVLVGQGLIGAWLVLTGIELRRESASRALSGLAMVGGAGLAATVLGFGLGGMQHPLTVAAGALGVIGTVGFYVLLALAGRQHSR